MGTKGKKFYLKHNTFTEDLPLVVVMKAMGVETDQEIMQLIGSEDEMACAAAAVRPVTLRRSTRLRRRWRSARPTRSLRSGRRCFSSACASASHGAPPTRARPRRCASRTVARAVTAAQDEAFDVLINVVLSHVPVANLNLKPKCIYVAWMVRRVIIASFDEAGAAMPPRAAHSRGR